MSKLNKVLRIGTPIYGYCGGAFGDILWGEKRVEGIGEDWIVVRDELGRISCATFTSGEEFDLYVANYFMFSEDDETK